MRRFARPIAVMGAAVALLALGPATMGTAAAAAVHDPVPIGPRQHFTGYVDGSDAGPVSIGVVCGTAAVGRPAPGQPVEVRPASAVPPFADEGYTGPDRVIDASLLTASGAAAIHLATFTSYYAPQDIPTGITLPCSGSGRVLFTPVPATTAGKAKPAVLTVTFVSTGAQVEATSHGCPGAHVCLYGSQSAFKKDKPTVIDADVPGLHSGGIAHNAVVVNNTIKYYASQGRFMPHYFRGGEVCEYLPDSQDEQSPNRIEDPADGASVTAIASGSKQVDDPFFVSLSYCDS
jgi:hypothetical protein